LLLPLFLFVLIILSASVSCLRFSLISFLVSILNKGGGKGDTRAKNKTTKPVKTLHNCLQPYKPLKQKKPLKRKYQPSNHNTIRKAVPI
jgi:hypothetical protein